MSDPDSIPAELVDVAQEIQLWASQKAEIRWVRLFGSRVKGTHRADSDLDVAIEFKAPDVSGRTLAWMDFGKEWQRELSELLGPPIHLVSYDPEANGDSDLGKSLKESSVLIYNCTS